MPIEREKIERILIYRCGTIGDTIVSIPAINLLRDHFPQAEFYLMTASSSDGRIWSDEILSEFGWFENFITYKSNNLLKSENMLSVIRKIQKLKPDLVIYLASDKNSALRIWRDRFFFLLAGANKFFPFYSSKVTFWGHLKRKDKIYPNEVNRLVGGLDRIGITNRDISFSLPIQDGHVQRVSELIQEAGLGDQRILVGMCPWSKQPVKRWPVERYEELGKRIITGLNADLVIVGGQEEADVGKGISQSWPDNRWAILAGKLGILETAEVLRRCILYVGNDTGAMHLAAAAGTPCVAIFAAKDPPESWHPYGNNHVVLRKFVSCRNCYLTECYENGLRCLTEISTEEVFEACKNMWANLKQ